MAEPLFTDIDLRLDPHPISGDIILLRDSQAIKASVKNIILTKFGERPFDPEFGSPIPALLFEPATPFIAQTLQRMIEQTLSNHEPRIVVQRIDVVGVTNGFDVEIIYTIQNSTTTERLSLTLERTN